MTLDTDTKKIARIVFTPSGKRGTFAKGTSVLEAARELGVDLDSVCGGRGICGRCQIEQSVGDFAKHGIKSLDSNLTAWNEVETRYSSKRKMKEGRRLGCQAKINGDIVVDVPPDSQVHKQVVRKRAEVRNIEIDPIIRLHYIEVDEPDMHHPSGDLERLERALLEQWGIDLEETDLPVLKTLQSALRKGDWKVTAAVRNNHKLIYVWPGLHEEAFGAAIDLGSTTMSIHLCNLQTGEVAASVGAMNPQIRFGEDLMSRVSYIMMNPGGEKELTDAVQEALGDLLVQAAAEAGIEITDILDLVIVGNPIMHHLVLGINPVELGWAPFALATNQPFRCWASEIGLSGKTNPGTRAYFLP